MSHIKFENKQLRQVADKLNNKVNNLLNINNELRQSNYCLTNNRELQNDINGLKSQIQHDN